MADVNLTQAVAHALIVVEKHRVSEDRSDFPEGRPVTELPLQPSDKCEQFLRDLNRDRIDLSGSKCRTGFGKSS